MQRLDGVAIALLGNILEGGAQPTWTDKEVLTAIGSVVATILIVGAPVILFLLRRERKLGKNKAGNESSAADLLDARCKLEIAQKDLADAQRDIVAQKKSVHSLTAELSEVQSNLVQVSVSLADHQEQLNAERRRVRRALEKDGQTWTEKVRANVPDFQPLEPEGRRTPIISVLNLKGGVGKTTVTANLGAALDYLGYRVLLLDLDLQGSLTGLFLTESSQETLFKEEKLLGDFLSASFDAEFPKLADYTQPILPRSSSGLVPTTDQLSYAETNLTIRWVLREGNRDPRFLLRKELHMKRTTNKYDIILLDCPPVINVSCVNALAASDYVLAPIQPSKQATARVPILLKRLKDFRDNINSDLNILGVVANRTHRAELTLDEENRLSALSGQCKDIWGQEVTLFNTFIRQNVEIRAAEDNHRSLTENDEMFPVFLDLAREIESNIPTFCKPWAEPRTEAVAS
jgi:cellulose biosynthesis protein BcsQ